MSLVTRLSGRLERLFERLVGWLLGKRPEGPGDGAMSAESPPPSAVGVGASAGLPDPTRLIVGLGNPGPEYGPTRHNIGFRVLDELVNRAGVSWTADAGLDARVAQVELAGEPCLLIQPQTFMNRSGASVMAALARWPLAPDAALLIVFDDLDLPPGRIRLRPKGGGGGHNGIGDILAQLDSKAVPRLRFGVGHPNDSGSDSDSGSRSEPVSVIDWVLAPFPEAEETHVLPEAIGRAADAIEMFVEKGIERTMGEFNGIS